MDVNNSRRWFGGGGWDKIFHTEETIRHVTSTSSSRRFIELCLGTAAQVMAGGGKKGKRNHKDEEGEEGEMGTANER